MHDFCLVNNELCFHPLSSVIINTELLILLVIDAYLTFSFLFRGDVNDGGGSGLCRPFLL